MCHICKSLLKGTTSFPEARQNLPRYIDLEMNKNKKKHYKELYANLEKAYERVFGKKDTEYLLK